MEKLKTQKADNLDNDVIDKMKLLDLKMKVCSDILDANSNQFEQKITYIGAGAIAAILVFAKEFHIITYSWILIFGLLLLLLACLMNLFSYIWFVKKIRKEYDNYVDLKKGLEGRCNGNALNEYYCKNKDIIEMQYDELYKYISSIASKRNKSADIYNEINMYFLFVGLIVVSIYVCLSLLGIY